MVTASSPPTTEKETTGEVLLFSDGISSAKDVPVLWGVDILWWKNSTYDFGSHIKISTTS
jgi:hypothetical protein